MTPSFKLIQGIFSTCPHKKAGETKPSFPYSELMIIKTTLILPYSVK